MCVCVSVCVCVYNRVCEREKKKQTQIMTKTVLSVKFSKLTFIHHLMDGLLGSDNIWLAYNYLKICKLRVQKNLH